jgi:C4-dicarboxylate-specific signal transduction histidine kinase
LHEFNKRIHPDDHARVADILKKAADEKTEYEMEYRVVLPDGTLRWLHSRAHPVFSASKELVQFVGTVMDVTELRRSEEALRQAQAELAHVSRTMTLGGLAASIAHEIRQPLTAIVADAAASLRWLAESNPKLDMVREALVDIVADGRRAGAVIERIRKLAAKNDPQKTALDVNDLIDGVVPLVRLELLKHHVSLRTDLTSAVPPVLGDRVQLQQVLINLVMNGVEAMAAVDDRPRELVIRSETDDEDRVVVAVQDVGVGLDPSHADRLFTAFFTTKPNGMGMGLAISRAIIERHSGRLWAIPNSTHGATFQLSLPAMR